MKLVQHFCPLVTQTSVIGIQDGVISCASGSKDVLMSQFKDLLNKNQLNTI